MIIVYIYIQTIYIYISSSVNFHLHTAEVLSVREGRRHGFVKCQVNMIEKQVESNQATRRVAPREALPSPWGKVPSGKTAFISLVMS